MCLPANTKPCGCQVGFCRAETLLDAATRAIMAGYPEQAARLTQAFHEQERTCAGGFLLVQDRDTGDESQ